MEQLNFLNSFFFTIYNYDNYHFTDNSTTPKNNHYIGCLIDGKAIIKSRDKELFLSPGEIFYIPKGLRYKSKWYGLDNKPVKFYSFGFSVSPLERNYILQKIDCTEKTRKIFEEICEDLKNSKKRIGKLLYFFEEASKNMKVSKKSHNNPTIEKAIEIMTEDPNLKISQIAKICNVSEPNIYSLFKRKLNKTPNEIRNNILCDKAISMLTTTNKSVQEISDILGFSSTSYFRKILKIYTDKTPLKIRKEAVF